MEDTENKQATTSPPTAQDLIPWVDLEIEKLPSRGLPYPKGSKVRFRTYSFGEVKLNSVGNPGLVQLVENTMKGVETIGFPKEKLTALDAIYLGVLRKVSTLQNTTYEIPYMCEACGAEAKASFTEKQLEFQDIDKEVLELPIEADVKGRKVQFSPMTVRDFLQLQKGRWKRDIIGGDPDTVAVAALTVQNMDFKEAYDFIYGLSDPDDIEVMHEVDKLLMHDLKPLKVRCKAEVSGESKICDHENFILLAGKEHFIRPFRAGEGTIRSRIRLGVPKDS